MEKYEKMLEKLKKENNFSWEAITVIEDVLNEIISAKKNKYDYDIEKGIYESLENMIIYHYDALEYVKNKYIYNYEDAIKAGCKTIIGIAFYYLSNEVYDLASKLGLDY